ncbi:MAG: glycoside hydrolase family 3 C-terminal domain-containing protein [Bacteroidaceae bacterium]|nr:glycoside hydrolase family 3 C-terminal domain-containing protein [Bacteroidaceae bacterium]
MMKHSSFVLFILFAVGFLSGFGQVLPYQNPELSHEERARDLCSRLTLDEKVKLMEHSSPAVEKLGVPYFNWWSEALHGVGRNGLATVFPITMGLAATWNDEFVEQCFNAISLEARAKNNIARRQNQQTSQNKCLSFWTPNINIFRDPRWGRGQETYGEDPYLTTRMGLAVVNGLQGTEDAKYQKLLACAKHFAVHSGPEWNRHSFNVEGLPLRDLWETYLPAFEALVKRGHVAEVMCAYQRFDGKPCCGSDRLLQQILRVDWGFDGLVTSDCWAIDDFWVKGRHGYTDSREKAISEAVLTGTDLECGNTYHYLADAVKQGLITEEQIDVSLIRLLRARFALGDFDDENLVPWKRIGSEVLDSDEHRALALQAGLQSIVLLQNNGGILPLSKDMKILVMGQNAQDEEMQWGNYNGVPWHTVTILEGIRSRAAHTTFLDSIPLVLAEGESLKVSDQEILDAAKNVDIVVFAGGISPRLEGEQMKVTYEGFKGGDRTDIELPAVQRRVLKLLAGAGKRIVYVNCSGSAIALKPETQSCQAIVQAWYGGQAGGEALAQVLFGEYNPSGKLPVTFYADNSQLPDYEDYNMAGRTYRYFRGEPLWAFGYGLSYTDFQIDKVTYKNHKVRARVINRGTMDGDEVVQVYLRRDDDTNGPRMTLRGFRRVSVKAGHSVMVEIPLSDESFSWWDETTNTIHPRAGEYQLMVGSSSRAQDLTVLNISYQLQS